jgi:hypothetical protein
MRNWDFTSGEAKLELGMKALQSADAQAEEYWRDEAHRKFQELYLEPLEPKIRSMLIAVHRLGEVLAAAANDCGMD